MVERTADCNKVGEDVARLIYLNTWASMNFFWHFTSPHPPPAERLSCLYIQWFAYLDATCKECLWIKCVFTPKLIVLINKFPTKTVHQLSITDVKMLLFTGKFWKIGKAYRVRNFFCLPDQQNSSHFFKLGAWRTAKTCACLLRFSALK